MGVSSCDLLSQVNGRPVSLMSKDGEAWERLQASSRDPARCTASSSGSHHKPLPCTPVSHQYSNYILTFPRNSFFNGLIDYISETFPPRDMSVLLQPADIVSKFRKQLKNVRSYKDFLLG